MDWLAHLLTDVSSVPHIILVYSLVIAVGALLGRIRLFGVSLGVTFVLFAAIAAGHFGFTVNPAVLYFLRDFGLTVFIYFIGLQVGPSFFSSFKSGGMVNNVRIYQFSKNPKKYYAFGTNGMFQIGYRF